MIYQGRTARTIFTKLVRFEEPRHFKTTTTSLEAGRKFADFWSNRFQFEYAFNLTRRWQKGLKRDFFEMNAFILGRWQSFPWSKYLYTSFGLGEGLSLGEEFPAIEKLDPTNNKSTSRFLNFLSWEITMGPAKCPRWSFVYRLHHRSGIFGTFGGVSGGSNVTAFGIRYLHQANCTGLW